MYALLRPALFNLAPETAHELGTLALRAALGTRAARAAARRYFEVRDAALEISRFGIDFPNPVGLAAGFDKAGALPNELGALGFGSVEIGTVTALAQAGNPRPRLFRLPADQALLNRMGFNNPGAEAVSAHLASTRIEPVLGINLGKSKATPLEQATDDYLASLEMLERFARYLVVNVSSPNTPGLRTLQDARPLRELLHAVVTHTTRPVLLKIAPDLTEPQIDEAVEIAVEEGAAGIIATNTTISREGLRTDAARVEALGAGGISGRPLATRADQVVRQIRRRVGARLPIVGVGGIFSAEDAWRRILSGASLVQIYTSFIYRGPGVVREINLGLLERLRQSGAASLEDVIGAEA